MSKGTLFIVSAPAGCGKDTILEKALADCTNLKYSVSATTRQMREGEIDGVSYFFKTRSEFEDMITEGQLLEHASYCGNYYGTPKNAVIEQLEKGLDVVLKIEVVGAEKVREIFPEAVSIFILPPSIEELRRRLHKRGTEDEATIERRILQAKEELSYAANYDYLLVNGELEKAILDFESIVNAEKLKTKNNINLINTIVGD